MQVCNTGDDMSVWISTGSSFKNNFPFWSTMSDKTTRGSIQKPQMRLTSHIRAMRKMWLF